MSEPPRQTFYRNLARPTIPGLDGIRGYAALSVVAFHAVSYHFPGDHAVRMFFVLSGFLITWLLLKERQKRGRMDLKAFYLRRAFRLLPPLAALLAWELILHRPPVDGRAIVATAFYFGNYYVALGGKMAALGHTWSLAIEEQFYLIWPAMLVLCLHRKRLIACVAAAAVLSAAVQFVLATSGARLYAATATEANSAAILFGCAMALTVWRYPDRLPDILFTRGLGAAAFVAVGMMAQLHKPQLIAWGFNAGIPFMAILLLQAVTYEWKVLENPVSRYLGAISYSIYLWQFVGFDLADRIAAGLNYPFGEKVSTSVLGVLMSVVVAIASHHLLELPAQRWLRARLRQRPERARPAVAEAGVQ